METQESPIKKGITRRAWIIYWMFVLFGVVILGRILYIQYGPDGERLRARAVDSRTFQYTQLKAERGEILARDGRPLAISSPYYILTIDALATGLTDSVFNRHVDSLAWHMAHYFKDKGQQQYKNLLVAGRNRARQPGANRMFRIAPRRVAYHELAAINSFPLLRERNRNVSGLVLERDTLRVYPYGSIALRTIGRQARNNVQAIGIEGAFDRQLRGVDGVTKRQRISGTFWMPVPDTLNRDPENGLDVVSTIDIELQDVAERALRQQLIAANAQWGTAILMEVATGEIRAMANLTRRDDGTCVEDLNHAIAQRINPGSTFKLANLIILLEDAGMSLTDTIDINYGRKRVGPRMVVDSHGGPRRMSLRDVFLQSSNVGFAQAVYDHYRDAGRSKSRQQHYVDQLDRLGVRDTLPFQLAGYRSPRVHDTKDSTWSDWSLPSMAYGYEVELTPLQTLVLYNTVANGGKMMAPLIVKALQQYGETVESYDPQVLRNQIASPQTIALVQECLHGVATDGTAKTLKIDSLDIAVKTGTAQIPNRNRGYGTQDYLATLAGYFPADKPKYSLIVAIQTYTGSGGGTIYYGGSLAGPVFRAIAERVHGVSTDWYPPLAERKPLATEPPSVKGGDARTIGTVLDKLAIVYRSEIGKGPATMENDSTGMHLTALSVDAATVPDLTGLGLQDAVRRLESLGMRATFSGKGVVVKQSVPAGAEVRPGGEVYLMLR